MRKPINFPPRSRRPQTESAWSYEKIPRGLRAKQCTHGGARLKILVESYERIDDQHIINPSLWCAECGAVQTIDGSWLLPRKVRR